MIYVYILQSVAFPERYYVGITADLRSRLRRHNAGEVSHTSKYAPWKIKTYIAFSDENQAFAFEKYLKSPSGSLCQEAALISPGRLLDLPGRRAVHLPVLAPG